MSSWWSLRMLAIKKGSWMASHGFLNDASFLGVGTGRFEWVLAFLATRPETSGFGKTQPATRIKITKFAEF
jgi:hypothetical protein